SFHSADSDLFVPGVRVLLVLEGAIAVIADASDAWSLWIVGLLPFLIVVATATDLLGLTAIVPWACAASASGDPTTTVADRQKRRGRWLEKRAKLGDPLAAFHLGHF